MERYNLHLGLEVSELVQLNCLHYLFSMCFFNTVKKSPLATYYIFCLYDNLIIE